MCMYICSHINIMPTTVFYPDVIETITEKRDSKTGTKQTRLFIGLVHMLMPVPIYHIIRILSAQCRCNSA